jgi:hypothetical protein
LDEEKLKIPVKKVNLVDAENEVFEIEGENKVATSNRRGRS